MKIPSARAQRPKTEQINIKKSDNFFFPPRDLGRIPSLNRPLIKPKTSLKPDILKDKEKLIFGQELVSTSTKSIPSPPLSPKAFSNSKKEVPTNLSDLI